MGKMFLRAARILLASGVLFAAVVSLADSTAADPEAGVTSFDDTVQHVDPGSPAWRSGIRAGDIVIERRTSNEPGGWQIVTSGATTTASEHVAGLRRYIPWSIVGLAVAGLAALFALRGAAMAAPLFPLALEMVTQPLLLAGSLLASLFAGVVVFLGGAVAVVAFASWRRWMVAVLAIGVALAVAWVAALLLLPAWFDTLDWARLPVAAGFSLAGLLGVVDPGRAREALRTGGGLGFVDVAYVAISVAAIAIGATIATIEVEYLAVGVALAVALYSIWRRNAIAAFDRLITSRARRDAAILAIEEERGRLARDIHDAPLQDLSGVIRRLDSLPGAEREADALRDVAARLRDVATQLRPPVLQDLGLVAAIEDLRDQVLTSYPGWTVQIEIDDVAGPRRPPADVELAALRVLQEATANALAHSNGRTLRIAGTVAAAAIDVTVSDDGHGFGDDDARGARRAGHFGLDSMRERAEAVDAESIITSRSDGVSVRFRWDATS